MHPNGCHNVEPLRIVKALRQTIDCFYHKFLYFQGANPILDM